jgi:hypothetical protein
MMVGNASAAASNATAKATTLRVTISGLPGGKTGDVAVTGPHFHKVLVKSTTFSKGLAAGSYVVTARSRAVGTGTYAAVIATQSVRIQRGRSMTVTVYYGDFVPRTTKAVSKAATLRLSGPATGSRLLTVSAGEASQVQVGDVLASAATAAAPSGYLVQVTKIASSTSSSETLEVVPTTLAKAIPEGEMSIDTTLGASDVSQKLVDHLRLTRLSGRRHRYGTTYQNQYLTCTTSATFDVETPTLSIVPSISLHVKWGFFSLKSALFTASVFESINMGAHGDAGASCTTKDPGIALFSESVPLADFPVDIAGIPAEVSATIQVYLTGEAGVTGALDINVGETATPTVGVEYAGGHFSPIASGFTPTFTHSVSASASASASAFLVPTVAHLVDGIAGPTFDVGGGVKLSADTAQDPWWELDGCIEAGVGFELDILGIHKSWEDQSLVTYCHPVLSASGGFPGAGAPPPVTGPTWSSPQPIPNLQASLDDVSCASPTFCMAADSQGNVYEFDGTSWSGPVAIDSDLDVGFLVICTATDFCLTMDGDGNTYIWNGTTWSPGDVAGSGSGSWEIGCDSSTFCYYGDGQGDIYLWSGSSWSELPPTDSNLTSVGSFDCASETDCLVLDGTGDADIWNGTTWIDEPSAPVQGNVAYFACTDSILSPCFELDTSGDISEWNGSSWSAATNVDANGFGINSMGCADSTFCVAVDNSGGAEVWNGTTWSPQMTADSDTGGYFTLSCPSDNYCVGADANGNYTVYQ